VDDQATAQFMQQFYQNLVQQHLSRAQAVQKAQLSLLYNEQFMNPYFWAPFILVGSWL
jgi:CHAT domain-containing protein